jgi:hypothetical protein
VNTNSLTVSSDAAGKLVCARRGQFGELATLWTKGWLETRRIFMFVLWVFAANLGAAFILDSRAALKASDLLATMLLIWVFFPSMLAGNGIRTPGVFRATAGTHQSMYFTLSLPVSRMRLLAVRLGVGLLETLVIDIAVVIAMMVSFPVLRNASSSGDAVCYIIEVVAYTFALYSFSTLWATFLEGPWRVWGTFLLVIAMRWLVAHSLRGVDILNGIAGGAPLIEHKLNWAGIAVPVGLTVVFLAGAFKVVDSREY